MADSLMRKPKVGFYGGTFDPPHFGHLNLALEILEAHHLDEVWFCPACCNPHKQECQPIASVHHRLEMLKLALEDVPNCKILDIEANRPGPSYTVDTLRSLINQEKKKKSPRQICLIIGDDAAPGFCRWHEAEEITRLAPIFVGRRSTAALAPLTGGPEICQALQKGMTPTPYLEISSTEIRKRLAAGKYCGHLVPSKVLDYIYQHQLYFIPGDILPVGTN